MGKINSYLILLALLALLAGCTSTRPAERGNGSAVTPVPASEVPPGEEEELEPGYDLPVVMVAGNPAGATVQEGGAAARALHDSEALPYGGEVAVAGDGELTLAFGDAGTVRCQGGTRMRVLRETAGWLLYLEEGMLDAVMHNLGGRELTVVAPSLTAGVRGTEFSVLALPDGAAEVFVDDGSVKVDNPLTGDNQVVTGGRAVRAELGDELRPADFRRAAARQNRGAVMLAARSRNEVGTVLARLEGRLIAAQQRQQQQIDKLRATRAQHETTAASARVGARNELARRQIRLQRADLRRQEWQLQGMRQWLTRQQGRTGLTAEERARLAQVEQSIRRLQAAAAAETR